MDVKKMIASSVLMSLGSLVFADGGPRLFLADASSSIQQNSTQNNSSQQQANFEQGSPIRDQYSPGFNQPGGVKLNNNAYDFFVTGSFIYWMPNTDGFNVSSFPYASSVVVNPATGVSTVTALGDGDSYFQGTTWDPGFKLGLGYGSHYDAWSFYLQWTRLHFSNHHHIRSDADDGQMLIFAASPYNTVCDKVGVMWKVNMDLLDFELQRSFYVGKRVIFQPFLGIRAAWFEQRQDLHLRSSEGTPWASNSSLLSALDQVCKCEDWGLGARFGMNSQYLLGAGFRVDGKASFSLLYSRCTQYKHTDSTTDGALIIGTDLDKDLNNVRPEAELGLGLGWGGYFWKDRCHFDLDVTYDFNMFWNMNWVRSFTDALLKQTGVVPSDLYYHGPTITARLDF